MINVTGTARLTKDPELKYTGNGTPVATTTGAFKRSRLNAEGNPETAFLRCVVFGKRAESFAKYTRKGSLIGISGEIATRSYDDQQGNTHYVTEIVVDNFEFLEKKSAVDDREQQRTNGAETQRKDDSLEQNMPEPPSFSDDDLPY
ncbi:single-stranded DNA-binding protein [Candidatus Enterococcus leclercqii]|uniref:single-stranded DNA-binding protein n=1 Tax=Candidatus Enterococcus leclercqii TaxID=1857218 RepID=UPI00137B4916|nr:single-stranded DNA-binding protein [Enterococcus sp. CU9D]KAF1294228.1 hypothetical protein BAU14_07520 [Enterococcus sp. CU9D]